MFAFALVPINHREHTFDRQCVEAGRSLRHSYDGRGNSRTMQWGLLKDWLLTCQLNREQTRKLGFRRSRSITRQGDPDPTLGDARKQKRCGVPGLPPVGVRVVCRDNDVSSTRSLCCD